MQPLGKILLYVGLILAAIGALLTLAGDKLKWIGHLPGDIRIERPGFSFFFPLATSILVSVGLSLLFWLFSKLSK